MIGIFSDQGASTENNGIYTINSFPNKNSVAEKILNFDISEINGKFEKNHITT